jgi:hypothetical protein
VLKVDSEKARMKSEKKAAKNQSKIKTESISTTIKQR